MAYFSPVEMARLMLVRPDLVAKVHELMQRFENETGQKTYVISGFRSRDEQAATFADSLKSGYRAAAPELSYHPLGAAVDLGIVGRVRTAEVDQKDPLYKKLAEIAQEIGLDSGYYFHGKLPDPYHLQVRETLKEAKEKWASLTRGRLWRTLIIVVIVAVIVSLIRRK